MARPTADESRRRRDELVRLLEEGISISEAARRSGVKPSRVLRLIGEDPEVEELVFGDDRRAPLEPGWLVRRG